MHFFRGSIGGRITRNENVATRVDFEPSTSVATRAPSPVAEASISAGFHSHFPPLRFFDTHRRSRSSKLSYSALRFRRCCVARFPFFFLFLFFFLYLVRFLTIQFIVVRSFLLRRDSRRKKKFEFRENSDFSLITKTRWGGIGRMNYFYYYLFIRVYIF